MTNQEPHLDHYTYRPLQSSCVQHVIEGINITLDKDGELCFSDTARRSTSHPSGKASQTRKRKSTTSAEAKKKTSSITDSSKRRPGTSPKKVSTATTSRSHSGSDGTKQSMLKKSVGKAQSVSQPVSSASELCTAQSVSKKSVVTAP